MLDEPQTQSRQKTQPRTDENGLSSFIWRTFVGNKKKEDFFRSSIYLLLIINGLLAFFLYSQKTQKAVYVIDSGVPKIASLIDSEARVDQQVTFFVQLWMKLLTEVNSENYEGNRQTLKKLSSRDMMKRILNAESASGNRLIREVIQAPNTRIRIIDVVIDQITRKGGLIEVSFSDVTQIDVPAGSEKYMTSHSARLMPTSYDFNGIGLVLIDLDNLWKLQRRL